MRRFGDDQDRAFDAAGLFLHEQDGGCRIGNGGFACVGQFAPRGAATVEDFFPAESVYPFGQYGRYALTFEIVKLIMDVPLVQPLPCFFDGRTVGDAIQGDIW